MILRNGNRLSFQCDSCFDQIYDGMEGDEFALVWHDAKRDGWRTRKIGEDWVHGCPQCGVDHDY